MPPYDMTEKQALKWNLSGWILFVVCSLFYIVDGIRTGSGLYLAGSIFFLGACGLFLIPIIGQIIAARKVTAAKTLDSIRPKRSDTN